MKVNIKKITLIIALYIVIDVLISHLTQGVILSRPLWLLLGLVTILIPLVCNAIIQLILDMIRKKRVKE
ncbi:MAG: hypothetical protein ACRC3H_19505 [Lachnospiraceae bacterium]